ncbi:MAG: sigma-70 family RNA polymerase sigma factor [Kiritimatiellae bacterium]|nr:sigma-70 family RNA polymerase sigma factor [Kiritimatiellia bacterium]
MERIQQYAREAADGSMDAFDQLVRHFSRPMLTFCRGKSPRGAEDLAQEVFVTAFRRLGSYNPARPFGPWLFAVARRVAIDVSRRRKPVEPLDLIEDVADTATPAEDAAAVDTVNTLWRIARQSLPQLQFQALELRAAADLSVAETAAAMGLTQTYVKVLLFRARQRLVAIGADAPLREGAAAAAAINRKKEYL